MFRKLDIKILQGYLIIDFKKWYKNLKLETFYEIQNQNYHSKVSTDDAENDCNTFIKVARNNFLLSNFSLVLLKNEQVQFKCFIKNL